MSQDGRVATQWFNAIAIWMIEAGTAGIKFDEIIKKVRTEGQHFELNYNVTDHASEENLKEQAVIILDLFTALGSITRENSTSFTQNFGMSIAIRTGRITGRGRWLSRRGDTFKTALFSAVTLFVYVRHRIRTFAWAISAFSVIGAISKIFLNFDHWAAIGAGLLAAVAAYCAAMMAP